LGCNVVANTKEECGDIPHQHSPVENGSDDTTIAIKGTKDERILIVEECSIKRRGRELVGEIGGVVVVDHTGEDWGLQWENTDDREGKGRGEEERDERKVDQRRDLPDRSLLCVVSRQEKERSLLKLEEDRRSQELQDDGLERGKLECPNIDETRFAKLSQGVDGNFVCDVGLKLEEEGREGKLCDLLGEDDDEGISKTAERDGKRRGRVITVSSSLKELWVCGD